MAGCEDGHLPDLVTCMHTSRRQDSGGVDCCGGLEPRCFLSQEPAGQKQCRSAGCRVCRVNVHSLFVDLDEVTIGEVPHCEHVHRSTSSSPPWRRRLGPPRHSHDRHAAHAAPPPGPGVRPTRPHGATQSALVNYATPVPGLGGGPVCVHTHMRRSRFANPKQLFKQTGKGIPQRTDSETKTRADSHLPT